MKSRNTFFPCRPTSLRRNTPSWPQALLSFLRRLPKAGGVVLFFLSLTAVAGGAGGVRVELGPVRTRSLARHKGRERQTLHSRTCVLDTGVVRYAVSWQAGVDPSTPDRVYPVEGYIGMPQPTSCNWYHSGFLFIRVNGQEIGTAPLYAMYTAEAGRRGILDMVWKHETAVVRTRFIAFPDADHVVCVIDIEPRATISSVQIMLRCYPSFFTAYHHRDGHRRLVTPGAVIEQEVRTRGPAARHWWCVYTDTVFDPARGEGDGPCAMLFDPARAESVAFDPGSYGVGTTIRFRPDVRQIRMAFWEFKGVPNMRATERIRDHADSLLRKLRTLDPAPAPLKAFDFTALRRSVEKVRTNPALRRHLGRRAEQTATWLDRCEAVARSQHRTLLDEADFLAHRTDFEAFLWEVKLAELLESIAAGEP